MGQPSLDQRNSGKIDEGQNLVQIKEFKEEGTFEDVKNAL